MQGLGYLLYETVKGVKKQFHSQTEKMLQLMLSKLGPSIDDNNRIASDPQLPWELVSVLMVAGRCQCMDEREEGVRRGGWLSVSLLHDLPGENLTQE